MTAVDTRVSDASLDSVREVLELDHVESHLHTTPSYSLVDHPTPNGREEGWRFTPLKRLGGLLEKGTDPGTLEWAQQLPAGVSVTTITPEQAIALGGIAPYDRLGAVAADDVTEVMLIDVPAETVLEEPIRFTGTGASAEHYVPDWVVVRIGRHAKATIVREYAGNARYNALQQVLVGDGANLEFIVIADWDSAAVHAEQRNILVGRDATVRSVEVTLGGDLVRTTTNVRYAAAGGSYVGLGLYFADAGQHFEHRLFVDHTAPKTRSNVVYKGALQGAKAHTVWVGNVLIRKVAEGIETYEENRNLILTDGAQADSVPNLEIETGEIEGAGHASATGRFDDEQLFYLRSRGISETEARRLVVHGFFNDLIRQIGVPELEDKLTATVEAELAQHLHVEGSRG
ncbi:MAG: Fe-S cluster assembly protein SufD [Nocardioides sp.]